MKVEEIMRSTNLKYCSTKSKLVEAATIMKDSNCGFLPVLDDQNKVTGIITDRDICLSLAHKDSKQAEQSGVKEIMSSQVYSISPDDSISEALKKYAFIR